MKVSLARVFGLFLLPLIAVCQSTNPSMVRFHTEVGDIDVQLLPGNAPNTVQNFLNYMNAGAYDNSIIHRSVVGFVFQGGGYTLQGNTPVAIPASSPVANEFGVANTQYTLAMALVGTDINSATSQWFFNEVDNSADGNAVNNLDASSFTVFGRINPNDTNSINTFNSIGALPIYNESSVNAAFNTIPLLNFTSGTPTASNYLLVLTIRPLNPYPAIATSGVQTASDFGGYPAAAAGSWIEIYGTNLAGTTRGWAQSDFGGDFSAPTSLDNVSVTIGGIPAYVSYVSPGQVNVQVPVGVPTSGTASVVLTYSNEVSETVQLAMRPYEGALLAPSSFQVNGTQYVAAVHANGSFVTNGKISGLPSAPAAPGETVVFYGVGLGPVTPSSVPIAGHVVQQTATLATPLTFKIGGQTATVTYAGLVQGQVGLYQLNVVVPTGLSNGDQPLTIQLGQQTFPQTLFLPVQAPSGN